MARKYDPSDRIDLTHQARAGLEARRQLQLQADLRAYYQQRQAESDRYLESLIQQLQVQLTRLEAENTFLKSQLPNQCDPTP
jgi:hypothetical protein